MAALTDMKASCLLNTLVHYTHCQVDTDDRGLGRAKTIIILRLATHSSRHTAAADLIEVRKVFYIMT